MRTKLQNVIAEYGPAALAVYLAIFFLVLGSSWAAIHFGWRPESVTGNVGALAGAYLATKVTQPLRIAGTLALTPLAARMYKRFARRPPA